MRWFLFKAKDPHRGDGEFIDALVDLEEVCYIEFFSSKDSGGYPTAHLAVSLKNGKSVEINSDRMKAFIKALHPNLAGGGELPSLEWPPTSLETTAPDDDGA